MSNIKPIKSYFNPFPFLFTGKFGNHTGRVVNGKQQLIKRRGSRKGKSSQRELESRMNMAIATRFLKPLAPLLKKYNEQNRRPGYHKAMSHILRNAIKGRLPEKQIDYSRVILGEGKLPNPENHHVSSPAKGLLEFSWSLEISKCSVAKSDRIFTVAYCEAKHEFRYEPDGAERGEKKFLMDVSVFSGQSIEVYFGFSSLTGEYVSTSIYAGSINVHI